MQSNCLSVDILFVNFRIQHNIAIAKTPGTVKCLPILNPKVFRAIDFPTQLKVHVNTIVTFLSELFLQIGHKTSVQYKFVSENKIYKYKALKSNLCAM